MAFFDDMTAALEAYPVPDVQLKIVEVDIPGDALNTDEQGSFRVRVTNKGPLNLTGVTLHVRGQNGATVANNGAAAPFESEFVTQELPPIDARGCSQLAVGSPLKFRAPWRPAGLEESRQGDPRGVGREPESHPDRSQRPARHAQGNLRRRSRGVVGDRHPPFHPQHYGATTMKSTIAIAAAAAAFLAAGTASAEPPANLGGTTWTLQANRDAVQLVITNQGGPGGPAGAACPLIIGTIGIAPIQGWYCPSTGRIHFLHRNLNSGVTVRVFTGNVSDDVLGESLYMGGTMTVVNVGFGPFGEYNFSASQ